MHRLTLFARFLASSVVLTLSGLLFASHAYAGINVGMNIATGYPTEILQGDTSAFVILLENTQSENNITDVAFESALPPGLIGKGVKEVSYICKDSKGTPFTPTGDVVVSNDKVKLTGGTIPVTPAGTRASICEIVFEFVTDTTGIKEFVLAKNIVTGKDGLTSVSNPTAASQTITISPVTAPTLGKSFTPKNVVKSDEAVKLTLTIKNNSTQRDLPLNTTGDTPPFALRDLFPAGLEVAPAPDAKISCANNSSTAPTFPVAGVKAGDKSITVLGGTVVKGDTCTITVNVIATSTDGKATADIVNRVNNSSTTPDFGNKLGVIANATSDILKVASGLEVSKSFNPAVVSANQESELKIFIKNTGKNNPIAFNSFEDSPIDGLAVAKAHGLKIVGTPTVNGCGTATASVIGNTNGVSLSKGSIAANSTCEITVKFIGKLEKQGIPEAFVNVIPLGAVKTVDNTIISNAFTQSIAVVDQLAVTKSTKGTTVAPGSPIKYTIKVSNFASSTVEQIKIDDAFPANLSLLTNAPYVAEVIGDKCGALSIAGTPTHPVFNITKIDGGSVSTPAVCELTFWGMLDSEAKPIAEPKPKDQLVNVIPAGGVTGIVNGEPVKNAYPSDVPDVRAPDNTKPAAFHMVQRLIPEKVFNPSTTAEGAVSLLTITLKNNTSSPLTDTAFTDTFPAGLIVADPASATTNCASGVVTAEPRSNKVSLSKGVIPARGGKEHDEGFGSCVIQVKVTGPAGTYVNSIDVDAVSAKQVKADGKTDEITNQVFGKNTLVLTNALAASKFFAPQTISDGGISTVRFTLQNKATTGVLNNVSLLDPLPDHMTIASTPNVSTTCTGSPVIHVAPGGKTASITGVVIPALGQCDFLFDVQGTGKESWNNKIVVGNLTADGGVMNLEEFGAVLNNSSEASIATGINMLPGNISAPGSTSVFEITLNNNGPVSLTGVSLANFFTADGLKSGLPTGMVLAANPNLTTTCTGGSVTAAPDSQGFNLSNATIPPGATCTVTMNVTSNKSGTIPSAVAPGSVTNDQGVSNGEMKTNLIVSGNLGVTKEFIPAVIKAGERSRLRITLLNPRPMLITDLMVTDTLPSGLSIPASPNAYTNCTGATVDTSVSSVVKVTGGTLQAAQNNVSTTCYAEVDIIANGNGSFVNTIKKGDVSSKTEDNLGEATSTLQVREPATIAKSFNAASVKPGVPSTVTITITNPNNIPLTKAVLTDNLPKNVFVAPTPNASTTCSGGTVTATESAMNATLTGGTIPANGSCIVKFDVISNIAGVYVNTIPANGLQTLEGVTNDKPANATLNLLEPPTVSKQFEPVSIAENGVSKLTIVLGNPNKAELTLSAALVDTLPTAPGRIVVAPTPAIGGTCTRNQITAAAGSGTVTYANGAKIPAGGCTIEVNVTGSLKGSYNNFIPSGALETNEGSNTQPANANLEISPLGFISGKVFQENQVVPDGVFDIKTDLPLANQKILLSGTAVNDQGVTVNVKTHTFTDALGNYAFVGLLPGTYTVTQDVQPAGTVNGITTAGPVVGNAGGVSGAASTPATPKSTISNIVLNKDASGNVSTTAGNNFAEIVLSSISGSVFLDQNNNGVRDPSDKALVGVVIELLDENGNKIAETKTNDKGDYTFENLQPGTYSVRQPTQPEDTINGKTVAGAVGNGGTPGKPSLPTVPQSIIEKIVLPPATNTTGNNFAELPKGRQIAGRVFADYDNDGLFNGKDTGLANVEIVLTGVDINGQAIEPKTVHTDSEGRYTFAGLPEGTYTVTQPTQPPRTTNGITTPGSTGGKATPVETPISVISQIDLTGNNSFSNDNNFAEKPILTGTVTGRVFIEKNGNNPPNGTEQGIKGVTILITGFDKDGNLVEFEITTDKDGYYKFDKLPPSDSAGYTIIEIQPALYKDGNTSVAAGSPGHATNENTLANNHDRIVGVVIAPGDVYDGYFFGEKGEYSLILPIVNGYVYMDRDHTRQRPKDGSADGLEGWTVELTQNGKLICTTLTNQDGFYQFDNLHCPGYEISGLPIGPGYAIDFTKDGNRRAALPTSGDNRGLIDNIGGSIKNITLLQEDEIVEQNLPLDPSGVIYDALTRQPIAGAVISITGPNGFIFNDHLVGGTAAAVQKVGADGYYEFFLQNNYPTGTYILTVESPPGYLQGPSTFLPACNGTLTVPKTAAPAFIQDKITAPDLSVPQQLDPATCPGLVPGGSNSTQYYYSFYITNNGSSDILNNHIPLDPVQEGAIMMTKTSPMVNVSRGDLVPYTITATNTLAASLPAVLVRDQIPAGFKYRSGSASINGVAIEPVVSGRLLTWPNQNFTAGEKKIIRLILTVGAGVGDGEYVNRTWSNSNVGNFIISNIATATVRVVPDPTFDCPDIIGKVFDDQNGNGYQDDGEPGIAGVRVVTARGLLVTTDAEGRFHVPCPAIPNPDRGSNFVMKLDTRTLPSGYRVTTENPRDVRLTRGKVVKLNFGATIHRVVRLELSDAAFEAGNETLLPQWQKQLEQLPEQLRERPSVVRLGYTTGSDAPALVAKRKKAIQAAIKQQWKALNGEYTLNIETEDAQ